MPEIAEVRTVAKCLRKLVKDRTVTDINIIYDKTIIGDINSFKDKLINQKINDITNYGKYLFFNFGDITMVSHMRMEGKYFYQSKDDKINKHEHVIFTLDNDYSLRYHDTRKFGRMELINTNEVELYIKSKNLGLEPNDPKLTGEYLYNLIHKKDLNIKSILLDQSIICGLGNIYVNEVLFKSRINPNEIGKNINKKMCDEIVKNSREITDEATIHGGTTIHSFLSLGAIGGYQDYLLVHGKKTCPNCHNKIIKIKVGGRGTYMCPNCQKMVKKHK